MVQASSPAEVVRPPGKPRFAVIFATSIRLSTLDNVSCEEASASTSRPNFPPSADRPAAHRRSCVYRPWP